MHGPPAELRTRLIQAAYEAAIAEGRYEAPHVRRAPSRARLYRDGRLTLLAAFFDYAYYAHENPDFAASGLDELEHYNFFGWRRMRNPSAGFDTAYYLAQNPDVRIAGDNPFWHYIFKGRAEGRAPQRPLAAERTILENLVAPVARPPEADVPGSPHLAADELISTLRSALAQANGFVFSVGRDDDPNESARLCEASERDAFAARGFVHLRASPLRAAPLMKAMPAAWSETRLTLDGEALGVATDAEIAKAFAALQDELPSPRGFLIHSVLGASLDGLLAIEAALAPDTRLFWLHDFASLCANPRLLRNDVAFCAAPPPDSEACGVCVYGEARRAQLALLERLFLRGRFVVVAPSERALGLWREATALPYDTAIARAPAGFEELAEPLAPPDNGEAGFEGRPARIAFIGPATLGNGWLTFERVLEACGDLVAYAFHHFADPRDLNPQKSLFSIEIAVASDNERPLREALIARHIDLVVLAAEAPQTFSLAGIEALAAGCDLVTLSRSGHVAALVEEFRRGRAFDSAEDVVEFFVSGKALAYARERDRFPRYLARIRLDDASAALVE